ncbi:MAG: hypothetical protein ACOC6J_11560 [Spirochaetota bacterium]
MTSRERFLAAMRNEVPDRVPVTPDVSNYITVKCTGLPFWEVYFEGRIPLWRADHLHELDPGPRPCAE